MADVIIVLKIMPSSPEVDLSKIEESSKKEIENFGGRINNVEQEPVAFGLKAIKITFLLNESKGSTDELEKNISDIEGVNSAEVVGITRAL